MSVSKVSIIIPTHNRPNLLKRAIQSVIDAKTTLEKEIIVIDNGDSEEVFRVISFFHTNGHNLFYHKIKQKSPSIARNTGIEKSTGDFLVFLDDDDALSPQFFQAIENIEISPSAHTIILVGFCFFYRLTRNFIIRKHKPSRRKPMPWERPIAVGSIFTKNVFSQQHIRFDESLSHLEDLDLSIQCDIKKIKIIPIDRPLYYCYVDMPWRKTSLTRSDFKKLLDDTKYFYRKHYQYYVTQGPRALAFLNYLMGMAYGKLNQYKKARIYFSKAVRLNPEIRYVGSYLLTYLGPRGFHLGRYLYFLLNALK